MPSSRYNIELTAALPLELNDIIYDYYYKPIKVITNDDEYREILSARNSPKLTASDSWRYRKMFNNYRTLKQQRDLISRPKNVRVYELPNPDYIV